MKHVMGYALCAIYYIIFNMTIFQAIIDFFFPLRCVGCKKRGEALCETCVDKFPPAQDNLPPRYFALYSFKDPVLKRALWELKYKNRHMIADVLGNRLGEHLFAEFTKGSLFSSLKNPLVIPIPIHSKKKRKRGYNQSELIARGGLKKIAEPIEIRTDILQKIRDTDPQARIKNRQKRLQNIVGSFSVKNTDIVHGRNIVLIDDVTTTGATMNEARRALLDAGARKVIGYAIAH